MLGFHTLSGSVFDYCWVKSEDPITRELKVQFPGEGILPDKRQILCVYDRVEFHVEGWRKDSVERVRAARSLYDQSRQSLERELQSRAEGMKRWGA